MDPMTVLLSALALAGNVLQPVADQAVKDAYAALKSVIVRKFGPSNPRLEPVLAEHAADPQTYERPAEKVLRDAGVDRDQEVLNLATDLLKKAERAQPGITGGLVERIDARGGTVSVIGTITQNTGTIVSSGGNTTIHQSETVSNAVEYVSGMLRSGFPTAKVSRGIIMALVGYGLAFVGIASGMLLGPVSMAIFFVGFALFAIGSIIAVGNVVLFVWRYLMSDHHRRLRRRWRMCYGHTAGSTSLAKAGGRGRPGPTPGPAVDAVEEGLTHGVGLPDAEAFTTRLLPV
jgi:hypothetical protein